jgi:hypothetical protein
MFFKHTSFQDRKFDKELKKYKTTEMKMIENWYEMALAKKMR